MKRYVTPVVALLALAACSDVATAPSASSAKPLVPVVSRSSGTEPIANKYIVRFRDDEPNASARAHSIERSHGATVERVYSSAFKGAAMTLADDAAAALSADQNVVAIEQDQVVHLATTQSNPTWGLDRIDQHAL